MNPAAILFDLDGTLIDTPAGITRVYHEVLAEDGRTAPETVIRSTIGRPLDTAFGVLLGLPEDSAEVVRGVARFRELFRDRVVPNARELIFPGIPAMLAGLRGGGHPLAIVTSKVETSAREILGSAGMMDQFDVIVCHGMARRGKPDPDLALLAAERLGRSPEGCVVVGDSVDDVRMAVAAGMRVVGVGYGVATPDQLAAAGADTVAGSPSELSTILDTQALVTPRERAGGVWTDEHGGPVRGTNPGPPRAGGKTPPPRGRSPASGAS